MSFAQAGAIVLIITIGSIMGFWMRRFEMQGFELWLSMAIIISYAVSPLAGFLAAMSMIFVSFILFPFNLQNIFSMGICIFGVVIGTVLFPVTETTFVFTSMILVVSYIAVSSIITTIVGYEPVRNIKFALLSLFFNYLIFMHAGWRIVTWLQGLG